jgi:hypothetical protein
MIEDTPTGSASSGSGSPGSANGSPLGGETGTVVAIRLVEVEREEVGESGDEVTGAGALSVGSTWDGPEQAETMIVIMRAQTGQSSLAGIAVGDAGSIRR